MDATGVEVFFSPWQFPLIRFSTATELTIGRYWDHGSRGLIQWTRPISMQLHVQFRGPPKEKHSGTRPRIDYDWSEKYDRSF